MAIVSILALILAFYYYAFPKLYDFLNRNILNKNQKGIVDSFYVEPSQIKVSENATIYLSIVINDKEKHTVEITFETDPLVQVFKPSGEKLPRIKDYYVYNLSLDSTYEYIKLRFTVRGNLSGLVNAIEYPIILSIKLDGNLIPRTWNNVSLTVRK